MTDVVPALRFAGDVVEHRVLGYANRELPGPIVVICGGLHGNEPAGLAAARRVLERIDADRLPLRGRLLGIAGNLAALPVGRRFLDRDLNRHWYPDDIERLMSADPALDGPEDREQRELMRLVHELERLTRRPLVFLDLHSTSADCSPFVCMADTLRNRRIVTALPLPVLFGLDEAIDGTAAGYLTERGHTAVAIEGGRSDRLRTVTDLESAIWLCLVAAGALTVGDVPDLPEHRRRLASANLLVPPLLEIRHRHAITAGDGFRMRPGFHSFQQVYRGQLLAHDRGGEIRAPESSRIIMPLYQDQGEDGYFLATPLPRPLLRLSTVLRRLGTEWLLHLVPGLSRPADGSDRWQCDEGRAPRWAWRLLTLFGYRRRKRRGGVLFCSRRRTVSSRRW